MLDLRTLRAALGGEITGGCLLCPGPGHSAADRSLSVKLDSTAPDGFLVHSFAGDDAIVCRDHVRSKAGLPAFKPNGNGKHHRASDDAIERALMAAVQVKMPSQKAKLSRSTITRTPTAHCFIKTCTMSPSDSCNGDRTATVAIFGICTVSIAGCRIVGGN
jgi:hypothetical protein